jgi:hypothetical protein
MKKTLPFLALLGATSFAATGCGFEHSTNVLTPSSVSSTDGGSGTTGSPSLVGTWASSSTALPSPTTCGNFQYQIISQTATAISGTFSGVCGGGVVINANANGQLSGTAVSITVIGTAAMPGIPTCPISLSGTGAIEDNGNTLRVPFTGTTCLGPVSGVEVLHKPQPAAELATLGEPSPVSPSPNQHLDGVRTKFTVNNASRSGPVGSAIVYQFEVANDEAFARQFGNWNVPEQPNQTVLDLPTDLSYSSVYYWHVRAFDGTTSSPWSRTLAFATPNPPPPPPPPPPGPGSCSPTPTTGPAVIACASSQYPEKLVAGVSGSQRLANMEFMRDRVIEIGICSGMDLGWNLKRGGPSLSSDAIVWRHGFDDIIDIGFSFDDTSRPLQLQWFSTTGAFYKTYTPRPTCR